MHKKILKVRVKKQKEPDESSVHILSAHLVWAPCGAGSRQG